jgi:hypothetical protein
VVSSFYEVLVDFSPAISGKVAWHFGWLWIRARLPQLKVGLENSLDFLKS